MQDVVTALRSLRRAPGFSLTAVLTLALGIAAATTVFSVSDRLLFRRLPYADPDRLVTVGADVRARGFHNWGVAADEFDAWRQSNRTLADLGGYQTFGRFTISRGEAPAEVAVNRITSNFLNLLGVPPAIGRAFGNSDFVPGAPLALLLTDAAWRRLFAADRSIVGRFLTVNGAPAEVAGVLPRSFVFPSAAARDVPDILVPLVRTKVLASIGIASVVSYSVARRTRQMGLRIALGARPGDVRALVVRESMAPVLAGLVLGIAASLTLSRFVESLLFGVEPRDVWTYAGVCLVLVTAAIVAAGLPARRASRVDPLIALRAE